MGSVAALLFNTIFIFDLPFTSILAVTELWQGLVLFIVCSAKFTEVRSSIFINLPLIAALALSKSGSPEVEVACFLP
jgi:hypothetical protein